MDKNVRNVAIITVVMSMFLILLVVLLINGWKHPVKESDVGSSEIANSELVTDASDEKSFLEDPSFLDEYQPYAGAVRENDDSQLALLVSSVERDLRVTVIDDKGNATHRSAQQSSDVCSRPKDSGLQ